MNIINKKCWAPCLPRSNTNKQTRSRWMNEDVINYQFIHNHQHRTIENRNTDWFSIFQVGGWLMCPALFLPLSLSLLFLIILTSFFVCQNRLERSIYQKIYSWWWWWFSLKKTAEKNLIVRNWFQFCQYEEELFCYFEIGRLVGWFN